MEPQESFENGKALKMECRIQQQGCQIHHRAAILKIGTPSYTTSFWMALSITPQSATL
jgi:hypothetical protein